MKSILNQLTYRGAWPGLMVAVLAWMVAPNLAPPIFAVALIHLVLSHRLRPIEGEAPSIWDPVGVFCALLIFEFHYLLITHFTGDFFEPELLSGAFDSLAVALAQGHAAVDPGAIRWEGMKVDGRTYMYFGPLPAMLRMPIAWIFPDLVGQWSRLSCFLAAALSVCGFTLLCARRLANNPNLEIEDRRLLLVASMLGFGLATPVAFVVFAGTLYNETVLWAFCCGVWSLHLALVCFEDEDPSPLLLAALGGVVGAALLARLTYGAPLIGVFGLIMLRRLARVLRGPTHRRTRGILATALCSLPLLAMISIQLWYNHERFGDPFEVADYSLLRFLANDEASWAVYEAHGATNVECIPTSFYNYLGFRSDYFSSEFPWFRVARPAYPDTDIYPRMFNSHVISLSIVSAWLLFGSIMGWGSLLREGGQWLLKLCGLGLIVQALVVSSYFIMEQRYSLDLLPALLFGYAFFLSGAGRHRPWGRSRRAIPIVLFTLVGISIITTTISTLSEIPVSGRQVSTSYKALWTSRFRAVNVLQAKLFLGASEADKMEERPGAS